MTECMEPEFWIKERLSQRNKYLSACANCHRTKRRIDQTVPDGLGRLIGAAGRYRDSRSKTEFRCGVLCEVANQLARLSRLRKN